MIVIPFYSDASLNAELGMGALLENDWMYYKWNSQFIKNCEPSIEYLELFTLVAGVITWQDDQILQNRCVSVHCDNEAVVHMVNNTASSCQKCMKLLRILVLNNIKHNQRLFAQHIRTEWNILADSLSRMDFHRFWRNAPSTMKKYPSPMRFWAPEAIWNDDIN